MNPTKLDEYDIALTFSSQTNEVSLPNGCGWELVAVSAEPTGTETAGGLWMVWRRRKDVAP